MYSDKFEEEINLLKADNISGSEEIVRKALQIVDREIESDPEKYSNLGKLTDMLSQVMKIKSEMFALRNVLVHFIDFYYQGVTLADVADRVLDKLDQQREAIVEKILPHLKKSKRIMTFSRSSTIVQSLKSLSTFVEKSKLPELILFESRPALEGKKLAREAVEAGYKVNYLVDSAMGLAVKTFKPDVILIGADVIFPNGNVANKIGCHSLAMFAYQHKIPFYVVSTSLKLLLKAVPFSIHSYKSKEVWAKDRPDNVKIFNPYFEVIPANLIKGYFTEFGFSEKIPDVKVEIEKDYIKKMYG
ncbi:MAG: hypothetical protein KAS63_11050 [Candidatus Heimdallarchaeota archaeon]|nr:hypothetical protein [Candidatus Heimdallarchaeota archaeon]MCK4955894.1 hypothetical protein [Candidatus Heimdallarchaeota archaeon]